MSRLTVRDIMTTDVAVVREDTPFKEIATALEERGVSALPVVSEDGRVVGIVSEADLLLKHEKRHGGRLLATPRQRADDAKATGVVAGTVMTSPAVTIAPGMSLVEAARLMTHKKVKRLPVVDDGRLVGIVSRADVIAVFARPDDELQAEIRRDVFRHVLLTERGAVDVRVTDGIAELTGWVERRSSSDILEVLAQGIDGVVGVVNKLTFQDDDAESTLDRIRQF